MELKIYDKSNNLKTGIAASENSTHSHEIMGDNVINLSFSLSECLILDVDDYIDFEDQRFWIIEEYAPKQKNNAEWIYECKLYGIESRLKKLLMLKAGNDDPDTVFSLTAPLIEHVKLVVKNINRGLESSKWKVGSVDISNNITIEYNRVFLNEALRLIADAANTEWWIDGETINLCRCEWGESVVLGYSNGLLSLEKESNDNAKFFTRLYPLGSTRNIQKDKYGYSRLQLPSKAKFVEQNIQYGIIEDSEEAYFSSVYPRRIGSVTSVRSEQHFGEDKKEFTIYYFKDNTLNFNPNEYEIAGLVKNIVFQSGDLNGRDFEVNYNSTSKEFEIITQFPYEDLQLPGDNLLPKIGDEYILYNILMPDEYYALAEKEYEEKVNEYLEKNKYDKSIYKAPTDFINLKERSLKLEIGQRVRLESLKYFPSKGYRESRIVKINRKINEPFSLDVEIGDIIWQGKMDVIQNNITEVKSYVNAATQTIPDVIKSWENQKISDFNIFSSQRTLKEIAERALSRKKEDSAAELITFIKGLVSLSRVDFKSGLNVDGDISTDDIDVANKLKTVIAEITETLTTKSLTVKDQISSFSYAEALLGWFIKQDGTAQLKGLKLLEFLDVPELRYNRVTVLAGESWRGPGAGLIESVDTKNQIVYLKLVDGDKRTTEVDDICKGIFHHNNGFQTVFFRPTEMVGDTAFKYSLRPGTTLHPSPMMNFISYGNFTNKERQKSVQETPSYKRYLANVNTWDISPAMIMMQLGDLSGLKINGVQMDGYSAYLNKIFMTGTIKQIASNGEEINVAIIRGEWEIGLYGYYEQVTHNGSSWLCVNEQGTSSEPTPLNQDWLEISAKGKDSVICDVITSKGNVFQNGQGSTVLTCIVRQGERDITDSIPQNRFSWECSSNNQDTDIIFNNQHNGYGNILTVTSDMIFGRAQFSCVVTI